MFACFITLFALLFLRTQQHFVPCVLSVMVGTLVVLRHTG